MIRILIVKALSNIFKFMSANTFITTIKQPILCNLDNLDLDLKNIIRIEDHSTDLESVIKRINFDMRITRT